MDRVTLSPKYHVVIPPTMRQELQLYSGQKLQIFCYGDRIELVPEKNINEMRGFLKGMNTNLTREADRHENMM